MLTEVLFLAWMQVAGGDPIRSAEFAEMAVKTRVREHMAEREFRAEGARRQFVETFNALVSAVEAFSKKYNEGRGQVRARGSKGSRNPTKSGGCISKGVKVV